MQCTLSEKILVSGHQNIRLGGQNCRQNIGIWSLCKRRLCLSQIAPVGWKADNLTDILDGMPKFKKGNLEGLGTKDTEFPLDNLLSFFENCIRGDEINIREGQELGFIA